MLGKWRRNVYDVEDAHAAFLHDVLPHVAYVVRSAPELSAHFLAPLLALALTPFADAEHDVASRLLQRVSHCAVALSCCGTVLRRIAVVVLQIVDAPRSEGACVLLLETEARCPSAAGELRRIRVDAELQTLRVDIVGERLYARRELLRVGYDVVLSVASALPEVVDEDIFVAGVAKSAFDHSVRCLADELFVDVSLEEVPCHPAHWRFRRKLFAWSGGVLGRSEERREAESCRENKRFVHNDLFIGCLLLRCCDVEM